MGKKSSSGKKNKGAVVVQLMSVNQLYNNQKNAKLVIFSTAWLKWHFLRSFQPTYEQIFTVFHWNSISFHLFPAPLSTSGAPGGAASADRLETGSIITMTSDERVQGCSDSQCCYGKATTLQGVSGGRIPRFGLTTILVINLSAWYCLGRWEFGRIGWSTGQAVEHSNQSQPNLGTRPPESSCT